LIKNCHFTRTAVPFEIPILEKADGNHRSFLKWKMMSFSLIRRTQNLTRTVTLICWKFSYYLNVVDFIRAVTLNSCTVLRHIVQKWCNSFYDTGDVIAKLTCSPDLNPLDYFIWTILQDLVYEGRRLPFANLWDLKEAVKNKCKEVTIETIWKPIAQWKNEWMWLEIRMEPQFSTFFANYCDWISTSCIETCWTYWLFCTFRTPNTLLHISLLKQTKYSVIISHTVQQ